MPSTQSESPSTPSNVVMLLAAMLLLVPALGTSSHVLIQDTLKSTLVAFFALSTAMLWSWQMRRQRTPLVLHPLLWGPLALMLYALGSMVWSHAFLGGIEAIRWFLFSLLMLLGMNTLTLRNIVFLAWGIHIGAVIAALWAALQFWFDIQWFPQGPNPGSTFVNRNFFAEYLTCSLPFSVLLLTRLKDKRSVYLIGVSFAFNVTTLLMAGMRSAMVATALTLPILVFIVWQTRQQVRSSGWRPLQVTALALVLVSTVGALGSLETHNPDIIAVTGQTSAIERAIIRAVKVTKPFEYTEGSFSARTIMWKSTGRMIAANPWAGVGAGAWEVKVPLYQEADTIVENDFFAHNEFLQLTAEYGLLGWLLICSLLLYLLHAAYRTWVDTSQLAREEAPVRAVVLTSLLALMVVSSAGFPWHMTCTGMLFALSLSVLAASDVRLGTAARSTVSIPWRPLFSRLALTGLLPAAVLAVYISMQAITCEALLAGALVSSNTVLVSGTPNDTRWNATKAELLKNTREAIAINSHYRKLTPSIADNLANWGDWRNAIWIWQSVLDSRPYVMAFLTNICRGYIILGEFDKAQQYYERAKTLRPNDTAVLTLQVLIWSRTGHDLEAATLAKDMLRTRKVDHDLMRVAYGLGQRLHDTELSILALEHAAKDWPERAMDSWVRLGLIYANSDHKDHEKAILSFQAAMAAAPPAYQASVRAQVPPDFQQYVK